jgi:hypothetical protein
VQEPVTRDLFHRIERVTRDLPVDHVWTSRMVADELVEAVRLCQRVVRGAGPSDRSGFWPQVLRDWGDLVMAVETAKENAKAEPDRMRHYATAKQITRMERAISWQGRYLSEPGQAPLRRLLALWLRCKASRGASFGKALKRRKISKATAYRARDRALLLIAIGLMQDRVLP